MAKTSAIGALVNYTNDIFISYATANSAIANRIYYDLIRSGIKAWLYENDGEIGIDFRTEIFRKLEQTRYLCLIDSQYARNSNYVQEECIYFNNLITSEGNNQRKIIIILVENHYDWREKEIFHKQNDLRHIDLTNVDFYDSKERYKKSLDNLCEKCGMRYLEWSNIASERDLIKELSVNDKLDDSEKKTIVSDYQNFEKRYNQNSKKCIDRINIIINDCESLGIDAITPYLALGRIHADLYNHEKALLTFKSVTNKFPADARGWSALGAANFYLSQYDDALEAYKRSLEIINNQQKNQYLVAHKGEIIHNLIFTYIMLDDIKNARDCLSELESEFLNMPEIKIAEIKILFYENEIKYALQLYEIIDFLTTQKYLNPLQINLSLADICFQFSKYYASNKPLESMKFLEKCQFLVPNNLEYQACLAHCYYYNEMIDKMSEIIQEGLKIIPNTDIEYYYYGLLKYCNNEICESKKFYKKSKLKHWPFYKYLIK